MANPNVPQGTINRLLAALVIPSFPSLNITASYLGKEGLRIALEDPSVEYIRTLTGAATSPQPFKLARITANLLKSQPLAGLYRAQEQQNSLLGDGLTLYADSAVFPVYILNNCSIMNVPGVDFSGKDADYNVELMGIYPINNFLFQ